MADSDGLEGFPVEEIPDKDLLYLRIHRNHIKDGEPIPLAFADHAPPEGGRKGLSTDWCRYSSPQQTQARGRQAAENYGVKQMVVREVRAIQGLTVEHDPIKDHPELPDNQAHTQIYGEKRQNRTLVELMRACRRWAITVQPP